jgi:hypothetical protein
MEADGDGIGIGNWKLHRAVVSLAGVGRTLKNSGTEQMEITRKE